MGIFSLWPLLGLLSNVVRPLKALGSILLFMQTFINSENGKLNLMYIIVTVLTTALRLSL